MLIKLATLNWVIMTVLIKGFGFFKIFLSSMSYRYSANVISTGIKANHTDKILGENLFFWFYLKV